MASRGGEEEEEEEEAHLHGEGRGLGGEHGEQPEDEPLHILQGVLAGYQVRVHLGG